MDRKVIVPETSLPADIVEKDLTSAHLPIAPVPSPAEPAHEPPVEPASEKK